MFDLLRFAAPIALASLGETVGQKSGVLNIGIEGTMLFGAFVAMMVTRSTGNPWLGLVCGMLAGIIVGLVQSLFLLELAADQVVVGTAINLAAMGITGALFRQTFGASGQLLSIASLPRFAAGMDAVILFMILSVFVLSWLVFRSKWGLALRACGEYPAAVEASGFRVNSIRRTAMLIGAAYAGLAGAYLSVGVTASFQENMTSGRGFIAIAMVTFGRFKPAWAFVASLVIGFAEILQFQLQARGIQAPPQVMLALPYLLALVVLVFVGQGAKSPQALGVPLRKERG